MRLNQLPAGQLAAGGLDIFTEPVAAGNRYIIPPEDVGEPPGVSSGRFPVATGGVIFNQVDDKEPVEFFHKKIGHLFGSGRRIIDAAEEQIFNHYFAAGFFDIFPKRFENRFKRISPVDRHQSLPEGVIGSVERERKIDLEREPGQFFDTGDNPDGGDGDLPGADAEAVGMVEDIDGVEDLLNI